MPAQNLHYEIRDVTAHRAGIRCQEPRQPLEVVEALSMPLPLLIFDTNIVMDIWLGRDRDQAVLLVDLAKEKKIELVIPELVLIEFRGRALRGIRRQRAALDGARRSTTSIGTSIRFSLAYAWWPKFKPGQLYGEVRGAQ